MTRQEIFNNFAKMVEQDKHYFYNERRGIIEDVLSHFGLTSVNFIGVESVCHEENLQRLQKFIIDTASPEQLKFLQNVTNEKKISISSLNTITDSDGKVFVSMPMSKSKFSDVEALRAAIKNGVELSSNTPYFIDLDAHNENISEKIFAEIVACKFLVADLSTQNQGVYYEIGYARALGKTVITLCPKNETQNVHFDIAQMQYVVYSDYCDLTNKLNEQIIKSSLGGKN